MYKLQLPDELTAALLAFFAQYQTDIAPNIALEKEKGEKTALLSALAYRWQPVSNHTHAACELVPLAVSRQISLADLHGIDTQKTKLVQNTRQFLAGFPANHALLTGARGGGKSSLVRALLTEFADEGLRLVEVSKAHLASLHTLKEQLQTLNTVNKNAKQPQKRLKYIIYCDDLAFNREDEHYRALKSSLDGSVASSGDDFLIYATSNRRHLIPQYMQDNINIYEQHANEVNPLEQIDETVSLADRFGLWLAFHPMPQDIFLKIVTHQLAQANIDLTNSTQAEALKWAASRGGRSGRVAYQFTQHWIGQTRLAALSDY